MQSGFEMTTGSKGAGIVLAAATLAPMLVAFNLPPSPTFLNQALANGLWGASVALLASGASSERWRDAIRDSALLAAALTVLGVMTAASVLRSHLPPAIATSMVASLAGAMLVVWSGSSAGARKLTTAHFLPFLWGLAGAGVLSGLIALVQVFAPDWADGDTIARSALPGRAVGNLRQPNHLASLLLWSIIATIGLYELRRLGRAACAVAYAFLAFAVVLTGSRTGALGVLVLTAWGLCDRRLSRATRGLLVAAPLIYTLGWLATWFWANAGGHVFGAESRMGLQSGGDISSSRFAIWSNAWAMTLREPLLGVGPGEFNLAWTLSEFPNRPVAFFDHTHNLLVQLAVELGLPVAFAVAGLLALALHRAWQRGWRTADEQGSVQRTAFMLVLMACLHSSLEYPLWYAHFLLPCMYAWGFALTRSGANERTTVDATDRPPLMRSGPMAAAGLTMLLVAAASVFDYHRIAIIYEPPAHAAPLEERIARGQRSLLFAHHADYAAATAFGEPKAPLSESQLLAFQRAPHHLLDIRLMIAWAQALAAQGEVDKARWLVARIREFRNPGADEFFEPCADAARATRNFQCQAPQRSYHWREFTTR